MPKIENLQTTIDTYYKKLGSRNQEATKVVIDVILPIFNGYDYFQPLFDSIQKTNMAYQLMIIDDCSTDARVLPYLKEYVNNHNNVTLITHTENKGYIKSVNEAIRQVKNHVVLLNSDIELPSNWLERLMAPILQDSMVASVTPFTNSGTICSFPEVIVDNDLIFSLSVEEIDAQFNKMAPNYRSVPTGVGFCFAMNQGVIQDIGMFDEVSYVHAYGEENDWCQRAIAKGYKNVIANNLFVYHKHGGSYKLEESLPMKQRNMATLLAKYKKYSQDLYRYCRREPYTIQRRLLVMLCSCCNTRKPTYLIFNHTWGGGATIYLMKRLEQLNHEGASTLLITQDNRRYQLQYRCGTYQYQYCFPSFSFIDMLCDIFYVTDIIINELVSYCDLYNCLNQIKLVREKYHCKLNFMLHDYYAVCPSINLLNGRKEYCKLPNMQVCEQCLNNSNTIKFYPEGSVQVWRKHWGDFLKICDVVTVFSESSKQILEEIYGKMEQIECHPHVVDYITKVIPRKEDKKSLVIGVLGVLIETKGETIVENMVRSITERNLAVKIVLIGYSSRLHDSSCFVQHGKYQKEELPQLITHYGIDLILIPSIWPETFSFTTEEAMATLLPVAVFDLGAPAERVKAYQKGLILSKVDAAVALEEIIQFMKREESV